MPSVDTRFPNLRRRAHEANLRALLTLLRRQQADVASTGGRLVLAWDTELATLILRRNRTVATEAGADAARRFRRTRSPTACAGRATAEQVE